MCRCVCDCKSQNTRKKRDWRVKNLLFCVVIIGLPVECVFWFDPELHDIRKTCDMHEMISALKVAIRLEINISYFLFLVSC